MRHGALAAHAVRAVAMASCLSGCPPHPGGEATSPVDPTADPAAEPAEDSPGERCGPPGERLGGLAWVPADARLTALIRLDADDLGGTLDALGDLARSDAHGLPMDVAFGLAHWDFQVPLLGSTLRQAGFEPAELAVVRIDDIGTSWVFGSTCDLDIAAARVESAWGVHVRRTATGAIGTPADDPSFAFDVVFLPGDRVVLSPAGAGAALARAVVATPPSSERPRPGTIVEALEPATVRAFVFGPALAAAAAPNEPEIAKRLRASAEGVEIDGRLAPSP